MRRGMNVRLVIGVGGWANVCVLSQTNTQQM